MGKKVTLDDIAQKTSLSKYAVSRAISGKSGVSDETRRKVLEACREMGYVKSAQHGDNPCIVMYIPSSETDDGAFWMSVIQGVEIEASQKGYHLQIRTIEETSTSVDIEGTSGVIYISHKSLELAHRFHSSVPSLLITYPPSPLFNMDCMGCADQEASEALCAKLMELGHRSIAYFGPTGRSFGVKIIDGIKKAMNINELPDDAIWNDSEDSNYSELAYSIISKHIESGTMPTAIMCASDKLAQAVIFTLNTLGFSVPGDISVTSFNSDLNQRYSIPLTTMGFDKVEFGKELFRTLFWRIDNPLAPIRRIRYVQTFVPGATAGCAKAPEHNGSCIAK